jgi:multimeric flavodoxin WrbA
MKVVALNGSARKDGNTSILINGVFEELKKEGIETELIQMAGKPIQGCIAMEPAEGILLGSPTYFSDVSSGMRAFIERCGFVARANDYMFKGKVGAAVVAVRRAGAIPAFSSMNLFLHYMQMFMPGASYWSIGVGRDPGDVLKDDEGIQTMKSLGQNMAFLLKKLHTS